MDEDLLRRLEKTAGIGGAIKGVGSYLKNVSGFGVGKARKNLKAVEQTADLRPSGSVRVDMAKKDLHNAKVDRNKALAGTAGVGVIGGAGLGGYTAFQKTKEPVGDIMKDNQVTQGMQPKIASDNLMDRLEKTANEAYDNHMADKRIQEIMWDLGDKDPAYIEKALIAEGLIDRAVDQGIFKDPTPGEGAAAGGVVGGVLGGLGGLYGGTMASALGGDDLKGVAKWGLGSGAAGALIGGGVLAGAGALEGWRRKHDPSDLHMKYYGGTNAPTHDVPSYEAFDQAVDHLRNGGTGSAQTGDQVGETPRQGAGSVSNAPAGVDKSASELMERLEKTANENEQGRQDRRFLTETFLGAGPVGYFTKKHNAMGINPEDSHAVANAKSAAGELGALGALGGGVVGAGMAAGHGAKGKGMALGALGGAGLVGGLYGSLGAGAGYITGTFHDAWDREHPVQKEASESELMERLEKTAAENEKKKESNPVINGAAIGGSAGGFLGSKGGMDFERNLAESQNNLRALMDDAPADVRAMAGVSDEVIQPKLLRGAIAGGLGAGIPLAAAGAGIGGIIGYNRLKERQMEQTASEDDLMTRLEKTAGVGTAFKGVATKVKNFASDVKGDKARMANQNLGKMWENPANHNLSIDDFSKKVDKMSLHAAKLDKQTADARKSLKVGAGSLGVGATGAGLAASGDNEKVAAENNEETEKAVPEKKSILNFLPKKEEKSEEKKEEKEEKSEEKTEEKTASEAHDDLLNGLFKEAAAAIINEKLPEVKQHVDPMSRIKF